MTRIIALSLAALALTAGVASAENTFSLNRADSSNSRLALTNVQADQPGTIEIYETVDGRPVRFLGSSRIAAGTTADVSVDLRGAPKGEVEVLMSNGNHAVSKLTVDDYLGN